MIKCSDLPSQKATITALQSRLGIWKPEDWYFLSASDLRDFAPEVQPLLEYHGSVSKMMAVLFPEEPWQQWRFANSRLSSSYWDNADHTSEYLEWIATELGIVTPEQWYQVKPGDIVQRNGLTLMKKHREVIDLLVFSFPEHPWRLWKYSKASKQWWDTLENQREFLDWFAQQTNLQQPFQWSHVTVSHVVAHGGKKLLEKFGGSVVETLCSVYKEVKWHRFHLGELPNWYWDRLDTQRDFWEHVGSWFGIKRFEEWYRVTKEQIAQHFGLSLIEEHGSLCKALSAAFPDFSWQPWKFRGFLDDFLLDTEGQCDYVLFLASELRIKCPEEWWDVNLTKKDLQGDKIFQTFLAKHDRVLTNALYSLFPEFSKPWDRYEEAPSEFWDDLETQENYLAWLSHHLGIQSPEDWYTVSMDTVAKRGGALLLNKYELSVINLLTRVYFEYDWNIWEFEKAPRGLWDNPDNAKQYVEFLATKLGISAPNQWYAVKTNAIHGGLLKKNGATLHHLLELVYPEYKWQPWQFDKVPDGYWYETEHQLMYFEWIAGCLSITHPEQWYSVKAGDVIHYCGWTLLHHYSNSLFRTLNGVYPEYPWQPWRFDSLPANHLDDLANQREYLNWLSTQLCITKIHEWYDVSLQHIRCLSGSSLVYSGYDDLLALLRRHYPLHRWDKENMLNTFEKSQKLLWRIIRRLFPYATDVQMNVHPAILQTPQLNLELDIFVPSLSLAFEYQGEQHFHTTSLHGDPKKQKARDDIKRSLCAQMGVSLIEIPFSWKFDVESIAATIAYWRPDVMDYCGRAKVLQIPSSNSSKQTT